MALLYESSRAVREFAAGEIGPDEFAERALKEAEELLEGSETEVAREHLDEADVPAPEAAAQH